MLIFVWGLSGNGFSQTRDLAREGNSTPAKSGQTGETGKDKNSLHTVETGDWVNVMYQFEVIKEVRSSHNTDWENKTLEESFLVGDRPLMAGLGNAVRGMKVGEEKQVTFLPRDAFGIYNKRKIKQIPKVMNIPKTVRVNPRSYVKRFDAFPIEGKILDFQPYLSAKVLKVEEKFAKIEFLPKIGNYSDNLFGKTVVEMENDRIKIQMEPFEGGTYKGNNEETGYVVQVSDDRFMVDFNHPLAGKTLEVEFTVSSLVKSKRLKQFHIPWKEDLDKGIEVSQKTNKPIFLLLYSKKCKWCEKLLNETLTDPGIKGWKDQLVWIKIDSNKHPEIKEEFNQDSYPLTVILDPDGQVVKRIEGFLDAPAMRDELRKLLFEKV
jgi:FKBP-type peptidyl-prolyl cis-trans isomerase 2